MNGIIESFTDCSGGKVPSLKKQKGTCPRNFRMHFIKKFLHRLLHA